LSLVKKDVYILHVLKLRDLPTVDDTLKKLLAAESAASELIEKAQKDEESQVQKALLKARQKEERFEARVPELHASFIEKSDQRARQTVAEMERRYQESLNQLREDSDAHEETALDIAFLELLGRSEQ
jgi:vacuolar-type H+-ATPase subunit H